MNSSGHAAAASYDRIAQARAGDMLSKEIPFRHFNNHVKKTLIQFALDSFRKHTNADVAQGMAVLDIASGRGGDLGKWLYMQSPASRGAVRSINSGLFSRVARVPNEAAATTAVAHYECYDISPESIAEAKRRFETLSKGASCLATFSVADCFGEEFLSAIQARRGEFHVVSIQFAFHYACDSVERATRVIEAVAACLAPGGVVLITTVDPAELSRRVRAGKARNAMYSVELQHPEPTCVTAGGAGSCDGGGCAAPEIPLAPCIGYHFKLRGFVDCVEYVVPLDAVRSCALACGLRECTDMSKTFADFLLDYERDWSKNRGNTLMKAEREVATLYCSLVFQKV